MGMDSSRVGIRARIVGVASAFLFLSLLVLGMLSADAARAALPASASVGVPGDAPGAESNVPSCDPGWGIVSSPNGSTTDNFLYGVTAISSNDVWAVGAYYNSSSVEQTLIEHWNGSTWSTVSSPNVGPSDNFLNEVAVISSDDIWAVGRYFDGSNSGRTLTEHWNGSTWSVVTSANVVGANDNRLYGVTAISSNDVWAVGYCYFITGGGYYLTLIEHWDGSTWNVVASPSPGTVASKLNGVTAVSSTDVWAVGAYDGSNGFDQTLVEHWNGSQWSIISSPSPGSRGNYLTGVTAISSTDLWAVGNHYDSGAATQTLTEHWDGSTWSVISSPNPGTSFNYLTGVTAISANDIWAVGYFYNDGISSNQTLTEHWDGSTWSMSSSPNIGIYSILDGVIAISSDDVWAVGDYHDSSGGYRTLTEHFNGYCGTPTSTATITPTGTSTPTSTLTSTPTDTQVPSSPTPTGCIPAWSVVSSPNVGTSDNLLNGVAAVSANDVWAVGEYYNSSSGMNQTLTLHWDGAAWNVVSSPNVGTNENVLLGVSVVSANDIWAVGEYYDNSSSVYQTLTEHWDGGVWSVVSSPNVGTGDNNLKGVSVASADDVWAVGYSRDPAVYQTLTLHWDGSTWSTVLSPDVSTDNNYLRGVTVVGTDDVWAVGDYRSSLGEVALILHWDGIVWSVVPGANIGTHDQELDGVAAVSTNDVWAVGSYNSQTLSLHWDGIVWSVVPSPSPGIQATLFGIAEASANDVWAAGLYADSSFLLQTLVLHWDGIAWSVMSSPNVGTTSNYLTGVAVVSANNAWAVGSYGPYGSLRTLVEQYIPCQGATTPTSTPSNTTTGTATNTPSAPTNTSTALPTQTPGGPTATASETATGTPPTSTETPTACAISFEDVPVGSTFYPYIQCMACRGIINGYPCGGPGEPCDPNNNPYFRPGNNVTRGQFAKITSNAAGFNETPGAQQYEDVLPGSTFYDFIWRLSNRGYINGYPCGGAGEPCGPSNLPYFRPNANVTRGQIAKIDANAAGYSDTPGAQQYEDVLPGSTFYDYIWRLSDRGLVNGYPCGGVGEPCGPNNLPYFRPSANATRGQASKIVSNTFFPACAFSAR